MALNIGVSLRRLGAVVAAVLCLVCSGQVADAQQYLGTISGEVEDNTGAKIASAQIEVVQERTGVTTTNATNEHGMFSVPFLQPGIYTVRVASAGFTTLQQTGIDLHAGENRQVQLTMSVVATQTTVEVEANRQELETGTATISNTIDVKEVTDLPNIGRNPLNSNNLSPGFYAAAFAQGKTSASSQPFGGIAAGQWVNGISGKGRVVLNGIPDDPPERGTVGNYTGFAPSPEAVQEVTTQTSIYDAQYGRSAGAITNTVLRTGANAFHGAAYYVFQNTYLNANTYERVASGAARTNSQWNQPGFVIDGPLSIPRLYSGRDRTFFMVAFERVQNNLPIFYNSNVPTLKMRTGDFSELLDANGNCSGDYICLYDPTTNTGGGHRVKFANNNLTAKLNPVGKALLNAYPLPNAVGTGLAGMTGNYISRQTSSPDHYYSLATRVDHKFSARYSMNAVYIRNRRQQSYSNEGFGPGGGPGYVHTRNNEGGSFDFISVITPKLVLDSRIGGIYHPFTLTRYGYHYDLASLGFPSSLIAQLPIPTFPGVSVSDSGASLTSGQSQFSASTLIHATELLSHSAGRHSLKYGIEYELLRYNVNTPTSGLGSFAFNRQFTQENGSAGVGSQTNSGFGFASLALGYPSSGSQVTNATSALQQHYFAAFVQDDWRLTDRLTMNLGLRYDLEQPFTERHNAINVGFCETCNSPLAISGLPLKGGLLFAGDNQRFPYRMQRNLFQPRIGVAYKLNEKQVIRAGFAIMYLQSQDLPTTLGFSTTTPYPATVDGIKPFTSLSNPYPSGLNTPGGAAGGLSTQIGAGITYQSRDHADPKMYQSSLSLQTQFPGSFVLEIAGLANLARDMELSKNIDALPASTFASGASYLQAAVANPMAGKIPSNATLNGATIQRRYLLVPFPQFTSVNETSIPRGILNYIAMQDRLTRRFTHNFSMQANFTWAKVMTNDFLNPTDPNPTYYQDSQPNLFLNVLSLYSLPHFSKANRYVRFFAGDWQVNGVLRKQNGIAVSNPTNVIPLLDPAFGVHPTYDKMFNNCYLTSSGTLAATCNSGLPPAFQQEANATYVVQTIHPYMDHVRNIIKPKFDLSVFKKFPIHESATFEIRGEFFNVLNSVNFGQPITGITNSQFGYVQRTQANDPRIGQLTARFNF